MEQKYICVLALVLAIAVKDVRATNCYTGAATDALGWTKINSGSAVSAACTAAAPASCLTTLEWDPTASPNTYELVTSCVGSLAAVRTDTVCEFPTLAQPYDVDCERYCDFATTTDCNNIYSTAPGASTPSCIQCTSESTGSPGTTGTDTCFLGTVGTTDCEITTFAYCSTLHTVWLDTAGAVTHEVIFRGCAVDDFADGCSIGSAQLDNQPDTAETVVTCQKTCSGSGCNNDAVPITSLKSNGVRCKYCMGTHSSSGCTQSTVMCEDGKPYCYTKVVYTDGSFYTTDAANANYGVQILYEERGCAAAPVTAACTNVQSSAAGYTFDTVSCEETCQGTECNDHWPLRPKCSQCTGAYHDGLGGLVATTSADYITWCKDHPPAPKQCDDPSFKYCYVSEKYVPDGDNEIRWGYSTEFERGCLKESDFSRCNDYKWRDEREAHYCQFVCDLDNCNLGSPATSIVLSTGSVAAAAVALFFKIH